MTCCGTGHPPHNQCPWMSQREIHGGVGDLMPTIHDPEVVDGGIWIGMGMGFMSYALSTPCRIPHDSSSSCHPHYTRTLLWRRSFPPLRSPKLVWWIRGIREPTTTAACSLACSLLGLPYHASYSHYPMNHVFSCWFWKSRTSNAGE